MKIKNVSEYDLISALTVINERFDNNVQFNRLERKGSHFLVTLRVRDLHKAGSRRTRSGRRLINACWHVHGYFFEALLKINPNAKINTMLGTIDKNGGNWEDRNIGSLFEPFYYSTACEC